jgi:large subunit ribosomal protein L30
MALIKITQEKSKIRTLIQHKRTLEALGLRRIRHSVVKQDTPQIRGMIALVSYLVRVEPATAGDAKPVAGTKAPARAGATATKKSASARKPAAKGGSK